MWAISQIKIKHNSISKMAWTAILALQFSIVQSLPFISFSKVSVNFYIFTHRFYVKSTLTKLVAPKTGNLNIFTSPKFWLNSFKKKHNITNWFHIKIWGAVKFLHFHTVKVYAACSSKLCLIRFVCTVGYGFLWVNNDISLNKRGKCHKFQ